MRIGAPNLIFFHRAVIIAFSFCTWLHFPASCSISIPVPKLGLLSDNIISWSKWVFGAVKCTVWPSRRFKDSNRGFISGVYRKSFRSTSSFFQYQQKHICYLCRVWYWGVSKRMSFYNWKDQLLSNRYRFLPLPFLRSSQTSANADSFTSLFLSISKACAATFFPCTLDHMVFI